MSVTEEAADASSDTEPAIIIIKPGRTMRIIEKKKEYRKSLVDQCHPMTCHVCGCEFLVKHRVYKDKIIHCPNETCVSHIIVGNKCVVL